MQQSKYRQSMQKIAILTSLSDLSPAYSVAASIYDQYTIISRHGSNEFRVKVYCNDNFNLSHSKSLDDNWVFNLPSVTWSNYKPSEKPHENFNTQVKVLEDTYLQIAKENDIIITHDLMFIDSFLSANQAIRNVIDIFPNKTWIHWVHSGPSMKPEKLVYPSKLRYTAAPHSKYVFLNHTEQQNFANMLSINTGSVHIVNNFRDIYSIYGFAKYTRDFIDQYNLLDHNILQIYPFSTPRWMAKGVDRLISIFSTWKDMNQNAKLVLVNAHANDASLVHVNAIKHAIDSSALKLGEDIILTSDYYLDEWKYSVPSRFIAEMNQIANIFIFPSVSEGCSLVQAEASLAGKYIVLNADCPSMIEFCDSSVLRYKFTINKPIENPVYYWAVANEILAELKHDKTVRNSTLARTKTYNSKWIWENQFRPLLYVS